MNPVDRFTRDEASAKVWWPLAMLLVVGFVLTFPGQNRAVDQRREDAAARAVLIVTQVVDPLVAGVTATVDEATADATTAALEDQILSEDASVGAIRLWALDGTLLYSTSGRDEVGSQAALNDPSIRSAGAAPGQPVSEQTASTPTGEPASPRLRVYVTLPSQTAAITEIEYDDDTLLQDVRGTWAGYQLALGGAGLLVLGLAILSMRTPVAPVGAGVKFYPTSVPEGMAVLGVDEATELRQAGAYARGRIGSQQERLQELEATKLRLEGELQRALSAHSMSAATATTAIPRPEIAPAAPAGMPAPAPVPVVPVMRIPDRAPEPEPIEAAEPEPVKAAKPAPEPRPVRPEPEPVKVADPKPVGAADDSMGFVLLPETEVVKARPARGRKPAAEVVKVPESDDVERHDAQVLDVLERLVEPIGAGAPTTDPGDLRARLARTAAAKKPGSRSDERFHEDPSAP